MRKIERRLLDAIEAGTDPETVVDEELGFGGEE